MYYSLALNPINTNTNNPFSCNFGLLHIFQRYKLCKPFQPNFLGGSFENLNILSNPINPIYPTNPINPINPFSPINPINFPNHVNPFNPINPINPVFCI